MGGGLEKGRVIIAEATVAFGRAVHAAECRFADEGEREPLSEEESLAWERLFELAEKLKRSEDRNQLRELYNHTVATFGGHDTIRDVDIVSVPLVAARLKSFFRRLTTRRLGVEFPLRERTKWLAQLGEAEGGTPLSTLLLIVETGINWGGVLNGWSSVRSGWISSVERARTPREIIKNLLELDGLMHPNAMKSFWYRGEDGSLDYELLSEAAKAAIDSPTFALQRLEIGNGDDDGDGDGDVNDGGDRDPNGDANADPEVWPCDPGPELFVNRPAGARVNRKAFLDMCENARTPPAAAQALLVFHDAVRPALLSTFHRSAGMSGWRCAMYAVLTNPPTLFESCAYTLDTVDLGRSEWEALEDVGLAGALRSLGVKPKAAAPGEECASERLEVALEMIRRVIQPGDSQPVERAVELIHSVAMELRAEGM